MKTTIEINLHKEVLNIIKENYNSEVFSIDDCNFGFISNNNNHAVVANELKEIGLLLVDHGYDVTGFNNHIHITNISETITVTVLYFNEQEELTSPLLTPENIEEIYWAQFYRDVQFTAPSTFAEFILRRADTPKYIIDIGCGSGRDSFQFAQQGHKTIGIDRSEVGITYARKYAEKINISNQLEFTTVDVVNQKQLQQALLQIKTEAKNASVMFYMRFFLHSITDEVQDQLMKTIATMATKDDIFAAEFRTDKDENSEKVHGGHYRRFQNARTFSQSLQQKYGFEVIFEQESSGLSPYNGEDPTLYRTIAKFIT